MKLLLPNTKLNWLVFSIIFMLAFALRFYRLNQIPYGLYWDEAAIVYNAYGLAEWNRDEHGIKLPLSFKSFGDFKAPLLIYLLGTTYKLTGFHPEYLRFLVASFGLINVVLVYFISRILFKSQNQSLWSMLVMAVIPWAVNFSRFGVEAVLALNLILLGTLCFLMPSSKPWSNFVATLCFIASLYAYHSSKLFTPLWFLYLLTSAIKNNHNQTKKSPFPFYAIYLLIFILGLVPLIFDGASNQGLERGKNLIFFSAGKLQPLAPIVSQYLNNIATLISPRFWLFGFDAIGLRHGVPYHGYLYYLVGAFSLIGLLLLKRIKIPHKWLIPSWIFLGLTPSLLSQDNPHAIRAMMALPGIIMLSSIGFGRVKSFVWRTTIIALLALEIGLYLNTYYGLYSQQSAPEFQYGYQEAVLTAEKIGRSADKIIFTSRYGQPYIYVLLYRKLTPEQFKFGALANYEFHEIDWSNPLPNCVYVASPQEIPSTDPRIIHQVVIPETDQVVYNIVRT